ncbi:MAG: glycosyltransferase family 4 protein [Muribaculaceae bacterium]|nr:glycosyltransferase family 4 protein [Muribaculaceae bacterium]
MTNILMCCSDLSYKGGMVTVVNNYLNVARWPDDYHIYFVPTHCNGGKAKLIWQFMKGLTRVLMLARKIDVAHLHVAERGSFIRKGLLVKMLHAMNIPVVLHHHGAEFEPWYDSCSPGMKRRINSVLETADLNIVLSRRLEPMITSRAPHARVAALYNAVATFPENPYDPDRKEVLLLGRLGERKGVYLLLDAIKALDDELPEDIRFNLCGDGEVDLVRQRVGEMGISHRIGHIGWTAGELKEQILSRTVLNVLPSYNEGLPMTILETMARGIPNISTRVASIPEVIEDGVTGLLIEPGNTPQLTDALRRMLTDRHLRQQLSENSFSLINSRFSLTHTVDRLQAIYDEVCSNPRHRNN